MCLKESRFEEDGGGVKKSAGAGISLITTATKVKKHGYESVLKGRGWSRFQLWVAVGHRSTDLNC